jgi:response regulator of citrate/malate metabolism
VESKSLENIIKTLDLAFTGVKTCKDIAEHIGCSERTARRYIRLLYAMRYEYTNIDIDLIPYMPRWQALGIKARMR